MAICLAYFGWKYLKPEPMIASAYTLQNSMVSGDGKILAKELSILESQCSGLDEAKLRSAWKLLLQPVVQRSKVIGTKPARISDNQVQAVAITEFIDPVGDRRWDLAIITNQTDDGARSAILVTMLLCSDVSEQEVEAAGMPLLAQIRKYRGKLEALGIKKLMLNPRSCSTWDELEERFQKNVDYARKLKAEGVDPTPTK